MLPRKSGLFLLLTALSTNSAGLLCHAQPAQPATTIRYHFGDDPDGKLGWASPNFDDSAWTVATDGQWPRPPFYSDGFAWVRFPVPVRSDTAEPLSLRISSLKRVLIAYDVFINGTRLGSFGRVPPSQFVESFPRDAIVDLRHGLVRPGDLALVTLRA